MTAVDGSSVPDSSPLSSQPVDQSRETPFARPAQRATARQWERVVEGLVVADRVMADRRLRADVRPEVRDSWARSARAAVPADLAQARMELTDDALRAARETADWLPLARHAARKLDDASAPHEVLSLFDSRGRMLTCDGDSAVLERLGTFNFAPGSLWSETAVGTNGPGTALATQRAVHIVGAEHFCMAWHPWHCAAVPLHDPFTGELLGVVNISGLRQHAHPRVLERATALALHVQRMIANRDARRHRAVLHRFAELSDRYTGDAIVAVDSRGRILQSTRDLPADVAQDALTHLTTASFSVTEQGVSVGACLLLRNADDTRAPRTVSLPSTISHGSASGVAPSREADEIERRNVVRRNTTRLHDRRIAAHPTGTMVQRANGARCTMQDIVGSHPTTLAAIDVAHAAARSTLPVWLFGEAGTGKELFARAIHTASSRHAGPFVTMHCATVPSEQAHVVVERNLRAAEGGTILITDVHALSSLSQGVLLRELQQQHLSTGDDTTIGSLGVRIMVATRHQLATTSSEGSLRRDLYWRLTAIPIALPPLRARMSDIPSLAHWFLERASADVGRPGLTMAPAVLDILSRNTWPGNVRELRTTVRRLASLCVGQCITIGQLPPDVLGAR